MGCVKKFPNTEDALYALTEADVLAWYDSDEYKEMVSERRNWYGWLDPYSMWVARAGSREEAEAYIRKFEHRDIAVNL